MDDQRFNLDAIINNPDLNLNRIFSMGDEGDDDDEQNFNPFNTQFNATYADEKQFSESRSNRGNFSVLSINIQSLSAKFQSLQLFIENLSKNKKEPDLICLQEIWNIPDFIEFNLNGYHPLIFKSRQNSVQGGGGWVFF